MPDDVTTAPTESAPAPAEGTPAGSNAGVTPAAARPTIEPSSVAKDQRPGIAALWEAEKVAGTLDGEPTPVEPAEPTEPTAKPVEPTEPTAKPAEPTAKPEDVAKLEGKTAEELAALAAASPEDLVKVTTHQATLADEAAAKVELDKLLSSFEDPAVLNAALERAGVDKIADLPAVKALIGRQVQSARDQTRAAIEKANAQAAQLAGVTAEGRAAKGRALAALETLAKQIENGIEEGQTYGIPTAEAMNKAFDDYAGAAVGEYHTKAWDVLSETVYSLPEMGGAVPEGVKTQPPPFNEAQIALLNAVKGADPNVWLAAHFAVERDQLWRWAQAEAEAGNQSTFEADKVLIQTAHTKAIKTLEATHATALTNAVEEARANALADAASGKTPPKTPTQMQPRTTQLENDDEADFKGKSPGEIRKIISARMSATAEV